MLESLLDHDLPLGDARNERFGNTPLHVAALRGYQLPVVKELIKTCTNVNEVSRYYPGGSALHFAALGGHVDIVRELLEAGADVDLKSPDWATLSADGSYRFALDESWMEDQKMKFNSYEVLVPNGEQTALGTIPEQLMQRDRWIPGERTPLQLAILGSAKLTNRGVNLTASENHVVLIENTAVVELILSKDPNLELRDNIGNTAAHIAALYGYTEIMKLLVAAGANLEAQTYYLPGGSPLHLAALNGGAGTVKVLLGAGANVNATITGPRGRHRTPLHLAAKEGYADVIDELKKHNPNIYAKDSGGRTALHWAIIGFHPKRGFLGMRRRFHLNVIAKLVSGGTSVDAKDNEGMTPLLLATQQGQNDLVEMLVQEWKADFNVRLTDGNWTALHLAADGGHLGSVEILVHCIDPNVGGCRWLPLQLAAMKGHTAVVLSLLNAGALVDERNEVGMTALHVAAHRGQLLAVEMLLRANANVTAADVTGNTAMHTAVLTRQTDPVDMIKRLLEAGGDPGARGQGNFTPLHFAACWGHLGAVKLLLEAGVSPDLRGDGEETVFDVVQGREDILQTLRNVSVRSQSGSNVPN